MSEGIELESVEVVEVTGKEFKDKSRRKDHGRSCNPSLRASTIIIFLVIGFVYLIAIIIGNVLMRSALENLDKVTCNSSVNRYAMLLADEMGELKQLTAHYSRMAATVDTFLDNNFTYFEGNITNMSTYDEFGMPLVKYNSGSEIVYWSIVDNETFKIMWDIYCPKQFNDEPNAKAGWHKVFSKPVVDTKIIKEMIESTNDPYEGWIQLYVPTSGPARNPYLLSVEPIYLPNVDPTIYGYLISLRALEYYKQEYPDNVPSCMAVMINSSMSNLFDKEDWENFKKVTPGNIVRKSYGGEAYFTTRPLEKVNATPLRACPAVPLFNETDEMVVGYMRLCGFDVKTHDIDGDASCFYIRFDRPTSLLDQGTVPVILISIEIVVMMIVVCGLFILFLDFMVLRRIVNLSKVIREQTHGHAKATIKQKEENTPSEVGEDDTKEPHGKSGKGSKVARSSHSGTGTGTGTNTSSEDGIRAGGVLNSHDEISDLKRIMEKNAQGLRKRLEAVNACIKSEQQKSVHHKQAMELLNLWCGRKDFFPGLRPNAMQLRYEPTRSLDDLLSNPLAIEYLKSHCDSDRTLENLWFLLDVSWLRELEFAEDKEEDPQKRSQIHDVASAAAMTIISRYIALDAPQEINISAASFKELRDKGDSYTRGMFDNAVSEVKLMLNTDILPRFQKSTAYSAMSETLYKDATAAGDESEISDETVSTAGSILTDEGEEGEGVSRVFLSHTFKNLHNNFAQDDASSSYSGDSSRAATTVTSIAPSASVAAGTQSAATGLHTVSSEEKGAAAALSGSENSSSSSSSSDDLSDVEPKKAQPIVKKEAPKKEEPKKEEPKKEQPKKEEPKKDSADASDHSISSDTMSISDSESGSEQSSSSSSSSD